MPPYCPITHLAMYFVARSCMEATGDGYITACFDASGQEKEHPYMVVAGFISSADEWIKFSEAWNEKLMEYGLDHFRASDCQSYQGQFATWKGNDAKRIALWCDLLTTIKGVTFQKFGCGI